MHAAGAKVARLRVNIAGAVQGVGFRPTIYKIAASLQLTGWVRNSGGGVVLEIQGNNTALFQKYLWQQLPALARIDDYQSTVVDTIIDDEIFQIRDSEHNTVHTDSIPDSAICEQCLEDVFNPSSRYFLYPFVSCTHCGPRYTITKQLPYDRQTTSMADFILCDSCQMEYQDATQRRYHAQSTACQQCGPQLSLSLTEMAESIQQGKILAIKNLGGYQLVCDAKKHNTIKLLRQRKQRPAKPFAIMALNLNSAKQYVEIHQQDAQQLLSNTRPIVLMKKNTESLLPENIAPQLNQLGIMLPSTALHYLLFYQLLGCPNGKDWLEQANDSILIVTSANIHGCPLISDDQQAEDYLPIIADQVVSYNRDIVMRVDDSVVRTINQKTVFIRRARGMTPQAIKLTNSIPSTIGLGGLLKNTVCITRDDQAYISQHIGDLNHRLTLDFFHESLDHLCQLLAIEPERIACDLHPDFYSSQVADSFDLPVYPIQHHQAHLAAVAAEHRITEPCLGLALDGFGYGLNGQLWGGELFNIHQQNYQHIGQLKPIALPGGDAANQSPWRVAVSILWQLGLHDVAMSCYKQNEQCEGILSMLDADIQSPKSSSCGRLFDAASSLLGLCHENTYEGQAAMVLESLVTEPIVVPNSWKINENNQLDILLLFVSLLDVEPEIGANIFHGTFSAAIVDWLSQQAKQQGTKIILLSGGCMMNKVFAELIIQGLLAHRLKPLLSQQVPANDAGLSLGQAWLAGNRG